MTVPVARADELNSVQILPFKYPVSEFFASFLDNYGTPPAGGDPLPLGAQADGDVVGFEVVQNVKRFSKYFIVCVIVPAAIMTVLSLITFIIPPSMVTQRVALNLSIILSLTALQFGMNEFLYPVAGLGLDADLARHHPRSRGQLVAEVVGANGDQHPFPSELLHARVRSFRVPGGVRRGAQEGERPQRTRKQRRRERGGVSAFASLGFDR